MTKDERVTIRLSTEDRDAMRAIAEANDEPEGQVYRRAIKAFLASVAVLVAVLGLTACGSDEPAEVVQPVASQAPEVAVSQPVESVPAYTEPLPTTATATDCWQLTSEVLDEVNAAPGPELIAYLQALPDPSEGCTDRDQNALRAFDEQLAEYLDTEQG